MRDRTISSARMEELKYRASHCCCKYCGAPLEIRLVVFGKFIEAGAELYCTNCDRIEYGVETLIYQHAKYFVEYMDLDNHDENDEISRRQQVAKACEMMMWHDVKLGILDEKGFKITPADDWQQLDCTDGSLLIMGEALS